MTIATNGLDGIDSITITDDGDGIPYSGDRHDFGHLGGSWKSEANRTRREKRILHGKNGQGRFRAFALGELVTWTTTTAGMDSVLTKYTIIGKSSETGVFQLTDPLPAKGSRGTTVTIQNIQDKCSELVSPSAYDDVSRVFAPYLNQYRSIEIEYNGKRIDTDSLVDRSASFKLGPFFLSSGDRLFAELEIIEWRSIVGRALYLCDENGFALSERAPEIRAPGFNFGAYLKSPYFRDLDEGGLIDIDIGDGISKLVGGAKEKLSEYFRRREVEKTASLIARWKEEKIYPYEGEPTSAVGRHSQRVFNMCAVTVHEHIPTFENQDRQSKALSFRLLREAIEDRPAVIARIMSDVLSLPKRRQEQLARLLDHTQLSSIIDAVGDVQQRLNVAQGLRALVCGVQTRNSVKEREHIHRIVERNPWIFGEGYALGQSESSLTNALREHLQRLQRDTRVLEPVLRASGKSGRIDLMLGKRVKRSGRNDDEHLIIELKRASKKLSMKDFVQLVTYSTAVMHDPRFDKTRVKWSFWLVGTEIDDELDQQSNAGDREPGCAHVFKDGRGGIYVVTWGQLVQDAQSRLEFVREKLNIMVTEEEAVEYLNEIYPEFVPSA